jgi:hypothetical protein
VEREGDVHRIVAENGAQALEGLNVRAAEILEVNRMSLEEVVVECLRKAYR